MFPDGSRRIERGNDGGDVGRGLFDDVRHVHDELSLARNAWRCLTNTLGAMARYEACIANVLLCRQLYSKERCIKCVWHRTCSTLLARDRCRPRLATNAVSYLSLARCHREKDENGRESDMFQHFLAHFDSNSMCDKEEQNVPDAPDGERTATMLTSCAAKTFQNLAKNSPQHVVGVCGFFSKKKKSRFVSMSILYQKKTPAQICHIF